MMTTQRPMPAEYLHSKRCQASALISAIQNMRDQEGTDALAFRLGAQAGTPLAWADEYLASGTADCLCHSWDLVTAGDGSAHGVCACGWTGPSSDDMFAAARDARRHAEAMVRNAWAAVGVQL